jgi:glycosyltransferase involved in cell wall biosynthesis
MPPRRLLIATDAWSPQVNGVVRTLTQLSAELERRGHAVEMLTPAGFPTWPLPTYPDIRVALASQAEVIARIARFRPDHCHIATEGPIGWAARKACMDRGLPFTTSYHTRFPEYLLERAPIPLDLSYAVLRHFHGAAGGTMVATDSIRAELESRGFRRLMRWGRGVDLSRFRPGAAGTASADWPRPIFLSVGRLAPEKNLDAFLCLDLPGTKVVVGDGPAAARLRERYPDTVFLGERPHGDLPALYAVADVFVFPSRTDTFGLVLVEALACGTPVAAFPVAGPRDVIGDSGAGVLSDDLRGAALAALRIDRALCRTHALGFTWEASADQFVANVRAVHSAAASRDAAGMPGGTRWPAAAGHATAAGRMEEGGAPPPGAGTTRCRPVSSAERFQP